jgi:hypothetical protein
MVSYAKEKAPANESAESSYDPGLAARLSAIRSNMAAYRRVMQQTGHESHERTRITEDWVNRTKLTEDENEIDNIRSREEFFSGFARDMMRSALEVHSGFTRPLQNAYARKLISSASRDRWMARYQNESDFKAKERRPSAELTPTRAAPCWLATFSMAHTQAPHWMPSTLSSSLPSLTPGAWATQSSEGRRWK